MWKATCWSVGDAEGVGALNLGGKTPELIEYLKVKYDARVVLPVGMLDHSGVSYYIGGGAARSDPGGWDSGTCGFILDTPKGREECGTPDYLIEEALTGEIQEYSAWAQGDCRGFVIEDQNGDEVESCWGFIGSDYCKEDVFELRARRVRPARKALFGPARCRRDGSARDRPS